MSLGDNHAEIRIGVKAGDNPLDQLRTAKNARDQCAAPCVAIRAVRAPFCMKLADQVVLEQYPGF